MTAALTAAPRTVPHAPAPAAVQVLTVGQRVSALRWLAAAGLNDDAETAVLLAVVHGSLRGPGLSAAWEAVQDAIACHRCTPEDDADHDGYQDREDAAISVLLRGHRKIGGNRS